MSDLLQGTFRPIKEPIDCSTVDQSWILSDLVSEIRACWTHEQ